MKKVIKRTISGIGIGIGAIIILVAAFFGILTIAEYRPAEIEQVDLTCHYGAIKQIICTTCIEISDFPRLSTGAPVNILTWNIGYASLDESQDFFMDGGKNMRPQSDENVKRNLAGIRNIISRADCDAILIQEADIASRRSYFINQRAYLTENFSGVSAFARNFHCIFVPIPFPDFIGRVSSGLLTMSSFGKTEALRLSLPIPFTWPVRVANLKRCLLVSRIPLENSAAELVLVNLHLEAYDSSGGREAQTRKLLDFLEKEYAQGNYCIAGGDFNQNFPGIDPVRFAMKHSDYFVAGDLDPSLLAEGWQFAADKQTPSCRLLNEPYSGDPETTQYYVIDGFILSPNIELIDIETLDLKFKYSDHNPVRATVLLK